MTDTKTIACVVFPGLTPFDLVGPLTILGMLEWLKPEYRVTVVAERIEAYETDAPLKITPSHTFAEVPDPAVLVVPGGTDPAFRAMTDQTLIGYLRDASAHAEMTASVCSGSFLLGAAGVLTGRRATTHWSAVEMLAEFGATPVRERWVQDGNVLTAAGVSAGVDMALHLVAQMAGEQAARLAQFGAEYDPEPPLGPLDWANAPRDVFTPATRTWVTDGLADDPELAARLTSRL